mgnify:CR=1 FL=1
MKLYEIYDNLVSKGFFGKPEERGILRETIREIDDKLSSKRATMIVRLPPGSGKTAIAYSASFKALLEPESWYRVIHVLPLRSIIEDTYSRLKDGLERLGITFEKVFSEQMFLSENTPYLQSKYAITTFDTFTLELMKLPPTIIRKVSAGLSMGHFEIGRTSIFSSLTVFDETHLVLEGNRNGRVTLATIFRFLRKIGVPLIIMTATLPTKIEKYIVEELGGNVYTIKFSEVLRGNIKDEYLERELEKKIIMRKPLKLLSFSKEVSKIVNNMEGRRAVIVNTISKAIEIYRNLDVEEKVLLHSQFTIKDRMEKVELLRKASIAITTQVIEAGVNVSFDFMISELAPITSIVQRIGRLARFEEREGEFQIVYDEESLRGNGIYDENYVSQTLKILIQVYGEKILWHLPSIPRKLGYDKIVDKVWETMNIESLVGAYSVALNQILSSPAFSSNDAFELIKSIMMLNRRDIIRNDIFATVYISDEEISSEKDVLEHAEERLIPTGAIRLFRQIQRKNAGKEVKVVVRRGNEVFEEDFTKYGNIVKWCLNWLSSRIITVRVPTKYYSREYGLLLY